jgi:hydroxymethylbilane synthase
MRLRGFVGAPDGSRAVRDSIEGRASDAEAHGVALATRMRGAGAAEILSALASAEARK